MAGNINMYIAQRYIFLDILSSLNDLILLLEMCDPHKE